MSKRSYYLILFVLYLIFVSESFTKAAYSQQEREKKETRFENPISFEDAQLYDGRLILDLAEKLNLTSSQEEKIEALMLTHESFSIRNSAEIKIKELRLLGFIASAKSPLNRKELEQSIREISQVKTDLIVHYMNYLIDVRSILTSQQLRKLNLMKKKGKLDEYLEKNSNHEKH